MPFPTFNSSLLPLVAILICFNVSLSIDFLLTETIAISFLSEIPLIVASKLLSFINLTDNSVEF